MSMDCDDLGLPNQYELPRIKPAPDREWAARGACIGKPGHWWFPEGDSLTVESAEAIAICEACPVRERCLNHALDQNESDGIWGGASPAARRQIRRATRGAA